jgi:hypothetical protein
VILKRLISGEIKLIFFVIPRSQQRSRRSAFRLASTATRRDEQGGEVRQEPGLFVWEICLLVEKNIRRKDFSLKIKWKLS